MNTPTPNTTPSIHSLYTFFLKPAHLNGKGKVTATIAQAEIKPLFNSITNRDQDELILHFSDRRRSLKCNKTQTEALWDIVGTDDHTKWTGTAITLEYFKARGGKYTIKIEGVTKP